MILKRRTDMNRKAIMQSLKNSFETGAPIPIEHLPYVDINKHCTQEVSMRRRENKDKERKDVKQD
jgi:hypothetical protein